MAGRHYIELHPGAVSRLVHEGRRVVGEAVANAGDAIGKALAAREERRQDAEDERADYPLQRAIVAMADRRRAGQPPPFPVGRAPSNPPVRDDRPCGCAACVWLDA